MLKSHVKDLMEQKGFTFQRLADLTGLAKKTIAKARSDTAIGECRLSTLGRIAAGLKVPLKKLYDGEFDPKDRV